MNGWNITVKASETMCETCGWRNQLIYVIDGDTGKEYWQCWACGRTFKADMEEHNDA